MRSGGVPVREIGRKLQISESSVRYILKHYNTTGKIVPKNRLGRRNTTTPMQDRVLGKVVMKNRPGTYKEAVALWQCELGQPVSPKVATYRLKKMGFKSYKS